MKINFTCGGGHPLCIPLFLISRLGSLNLLDTRRAPTWYRVRSRQLLSLFIQREKGFAYPPVSLRKFFDRIFPLSSSVLPVRVHRDRRDSLTAAYRLDSSLNKGTIRVKNEAGIAQECVYFEPAYFVSPLCRGKEKRIDHRENRGV